VACSVSAVRAAGDGNNFLGFSSMFRSFSITRKGSSSSRSRLPNSLTPSSSVPWRATTRNARSSPVHKPYQARQVVDELMKSSPVGIDAVLLLSGNVVRVWISDR
jgi:hypothetical protein